jgi:hypothetical protein
VQTLRFNVLVVLILLLGSVRIEASSVGPSVLDFIPVSILQVVSGM